MKQIISILFLLITFQIYSQSETYSLIYNSGSYNTIHDIIETRDRNLLAVGQINNGNNDVFAMKTDPSGNVIWSNSYGTNDIEQAYGVVEIPDSGFVMVSESRVSGAGGTTQVLLIRIDKDGNEVWSRVISGSTKDAANDLALTSDTNICVVGKRLSGSSNHIIAIKVDLDGNVVWEREFDTGSSEGKAVERTKDGAIILAHGGSSVGLIKLDNDGNILWSRTHGATGGSIITNDICNSIDGGYMVVGSLSGIGSGAEDVAVLKVDANGNVDWFNAYGGFYGEEAFSIVELNNSYIIGGQTASFGNTSADGLSMLLSNSGSVLWATVHNSDFDGIVNQAIPVFSGGYVIAGYTNSLSLSARDYWLSKIETTGTTSCQETQASFTELALSYASSSPVPVVTTPGVTSVAPSLSMSSTVMTTIIDCDYTVVNTEVFHKVMGNGQADQANSIKQTPDGGYIVVGNTNNSVFGNTDIALIKLTAQGDTSWTKIFGGDASDNGNDVILTNDGGYLICGSSFSSFASDNVLLIKTDVNGQEMWTRTYEGNDAHSLIRTSNGGYAVATNTNNDAGILKLNAVGNIEWYKSYQAGRDGNKVIEANNGNFILVSDENTSASNAYVTRVTSSGNVIWSKSYGGALQEGVESIIELKNNDLIMVGSTKTYDESIFTDMLVMRLDASGDTIWSKAIHKSVHERAYDITRTENGFAITGWAYGDLALIEFDLLGNIIWSRGFGDSFGDTGYGIIQTIDRGFAIVGYAEDFSNGDNDIYVIKTDSLGKSSGCFDAPITVTSRDISPIITIGSPTVNDFIFVYNDNIQETRGLQLVLDLSINDSVTITNISCNGLSDGEIDLSVSGGFLPYTYSWSTGSTDEDVNGLAMGNYTVTITDAKGCEIINTVDLTEPDVINVSMSSEATSCFGGADGTTSAIVTGGVSPYSYLWNTGQQTQTAVGLFAGTHTVNVFDANGCLGSNFIVVDEPSEITASFTVTDASCGSEDGVVEVIPLGGTFPYTQEWGNGFTGDELLNVGEGYHTIVITDTNGCEKQDSVYVGTGVNPVNLCVITVDDDGNNLLVWEKPVVNNISGYNIYRNISGAYSLIGFQPYDSLSQYADLSFGVDPNVTSYRYKISALDTCGNESELSDFHETIHLTTNSGTQGEVNLIWDDYEGVDFTSYNILLDSTDSGNYNIIASVPNTNFTYTDLNPPGDSASYIIEVVLGTPCVSSKTKRGEKVNHNSTRSNVSRPGSVGQILNVTENIERFVSIYPNPVKDILNVELSNGIEWNYKVFNVTGEIVVQQYGILNTTESINTSQWKKGIYLIQLSSSDQLVNRRIIK